MIKPITPDEVKHSIPDFIIEAVNNLIQEKWDGHSAVITQDEILDLVTCDETDWGDNSKPTRKKVFDKGWLDFEPIYRNVGWNVEYDKPGFNETYKAYFKFTKDFL